MTHNNSIPRLPRGVGRRAQSAPRGPPGSLVNTIDMKFRLVPKGEGVMGSYGWEDTQPVHKVKILRPFYMSIYPVTQRQWMKVMGTNPSYHRGPNKPVEMVSWPDVHQFFRVLNSLEETRRYRLPTEIEWEYVARAGFTSDYLFESNEELLKQSGWYVDNSDDRTHSVGQKKPNPWGFYDMLGNVWEWCYDRWHDDYEGAPSNNVPWQRDGALFRVDRGGSFSSALEKCNPSCRDWNVPSDKMPFLGFRAVMEY